MKKILLVLAFVLSAILFGGLFFLGGSWLLKMANFVRPKDVFGLLILAPIAGAVLGLYVCAVVLDYLDVDATW